MNNMIFADTVFNAEVSERAGFIRRTYAHVALAVIAFIAIEAILLESPIAAMMVGMMTSRYSWLLVLGAFMGISWLADKWAQSDTSVGMQYLGLGIYVMAEAVIFLPLLYMASYFASPDVIPMAGLMTLFLFAGLTMTVFITRKDFSWLGSILAVGGFVALGVIVASIIFGFTLGVFFSAVMVLFAAGAILYDTSRVLHHYRTNQHVAASLSLFASVALLFWYILRILMRIR